MLGAVVVFVQIATVWFVLRTARARRAVRASAFVILMITGLVAITGGVLGGTGSQLAILLASTVLYLIAPIVVVRHLIGRSVVDRETFLGVIAAYLLIGMFFAFVYRVVGVLEPDPFFGAGGEANPAQALFFSFTTYSTTGYGNLVPAGQHRADDRGGRDDRRPAVPHHRARQGRLRVVAYREECGRNTRDRRRPRVVLAIAVGKRLPEGCQLQPHARPDERPSGLPLRAHAVGFLKRRFRLCPGRRAPSEAGVRGPAPVGDPLRRTRG